VFRRPEFLAIGHVCYDRRDEGYVIGGSAAYSALLARNLGYRAAVLTSATADFPFESALPGVAVRVTPSPRNTVFVNRRRGARRIQFVESVAEGIDLGLLPRSWARPKIAYLCPIIGEFSAAAALEVLRARVVGIAPQGWLRRPTSKGFVARTSWTELEEVAEKADFIVASHEELDRDEVELYARLAQIFLLTHGKEGVDLFLGGTYWGRIPAVPARELDETGAGDVFGAAFAVRYYEIRDPVKAAHFAAAAASLSVEEVGLGGIPETRDDVFFRLSKAEKEGIITNGLGHHMESRTGV